MLPILCYAFAFLCNDKTGCPAPSLLSPSTLSLDKLRRETGWPGFANLLSWKVLGWVAAYYGLSLAMQAFLQGESAEGTVLRNGRRLRYKFNGMSEHYGS